MSPALRGIKRTHPNNVARYIDSLMQYFKKHDVSKRLLQLQHKFCLTTYGRLDKTINEGMLYAESLCKRSNRLLWNPDVQDILSVIRVLKIHLSGIRNYQYFSIAIENKLSLINQAVNLPPTIPETTKLLRKQQQKFRQMAKDSRAKTQSLIDQREEAYIQIRPNLDPIKTSSIFRQSQTTKSMMNELPGKKGSRRLSTIMIPMPKEGLMLGYMTITDTKTIEHLLFARNKRHFRQAGFTPLVNHATCHHIGFGADTTIAEAILDETVDLPGLTSDKWSQLFLKQCR